MHHFNITIEKNGVRGTCSVLYPCEVSFTVQQLRSKISEIGNVRLPPDSILFICPLGLDGSIRNAYNELDFEIESRLRVVNHVVILPYGPDGRLIEDEVQFLRGDPWSVKDEFLAQIAENCIESALPSTNFILRPPHGYKFRNPSGHEVDFFMRAGNMLSELGLLFVFSHLLIRRMPKNTRTIYIDSFTVLSFALRIQSLIAYFSRRNFGTETVVPTIQIFRSYNVESTFSLPNMDEYFIIISASTSNGLANKLINDHNADISRIVHMLGIGSSESELIKSSIHFIKQELAIINSETNKIIGITTDEFMTSHGNPTWVRLSNKHVCKIHASELKDTFYQKCLQITKSGTESGYGPYSLFTINNELSDCWSKAFTQWLRYELIHDLPATTRTIVHLKDPMSKKMGEELKSRLQNITKLDNISLFSTTELDYQISKVPDCSTVVVVAIQDPGLDQFGSISMQLRNHSNVYQHYIVGYAFPESKTQFKRMAYDIKLAPESKPKYQLSNFLVSPVGATNLHESLFTDYGIDRTRVNELSSHGIVDKIVRRLSEGMQACNLFFPSLKGEKLELRGGSIFFTDNENTEVSEKQSTLPTLSQEVVYLAVVLALQQAREEENSLASDFKFDQNPFVKTVIDPKMFWRYNDGILQAALLRALSNSELDFSTSEEMSTQFRQITISVLKNSYNIAGEATLEFLAVVAKKKVSLRDQDFNCIEKFALEDETLAVLWKYFCFQIPI